MDTAQPPTDEPAQAAGPLAPIAPPERVVVIDVLRGFAVFGILLVNMAFFNGPLYAALLETQWWTSPADRLATWTIRTLAEGKFYSLFSFLFGLGMAIQMQRIEARGGRFAPLYVRRLLVLLLIGLSHALFFWYGDILMYYALLGFLLLLFRKRANKTILIWALAIYCLPLLLEAALAALVQAAQHDPDAAVELEREFAEAGQRMVALAHQSVAIYARGSFDELMAQRVLDLQHMLIGLFVIVPGVFTMFLLGLYVGRRGILHDPSGHRGLLRRLLLWGLPLGFLCHLGYTASLEFGSRWIPSWTSCGGLLLYLLGAPLLSLGYAAGIVLLVGEEAWRKRLAPLAAVGRMTLTNYLLQTLICTTLFYSYGFGLFGKVGPALGVLLTVIIYLLQVVFSVWWQRRFRFGPLEWLWRCLTYARWQPIRRAAAE